MSHFVALLFAGACEVLGVLFLAKLKNAKGIKKAVNFILVAFTFFCSLMLLRYSMRAIAMSVAYAIWTGMGAIGAVGVGMAFNKEKMSAQKAFYLFLITFSVIMLKII